VPEVYVNAAVVERISSGIMSASRRDRADPQGADLDFAQEHDVEEVTDDGAKAHHITPT